MCHHAWPSQFLLSQTPLYPQSGTLPFLILAPPTSSPRFCADEILSWKDLKPLPCKSGLALSSLPCLYSQWSLCKGGSRIWELPPNVVPLASPRATAKQFMSSGPSGSLRINYEGQRCSTTRAVSADTVGLGMTL